MNSILRGVRGNFIKQKHTIIPWIHIIVPILGALIFNFYFYNYPTVENVKRLQLIIECATSIFPILIGITTCIFLGIEEKSGYYRWFLGIGTSRTASLCSFIIYILIWGCISCFLLWIATFIGFRAQGIYIEGLINLFLKISIFFIIGNIFTYVFHIIVGMRFGMGASLILSVFESVFVLLMGNMGELDKWSAWKYLPHAFTVKISQISLWKSFGINVNVSCVTSYIMLITLNIIFIIFSINWIKRWEGRKN